MILWSGSEVVKTYDAMSQIFAGQRRKNSVAQSFSIALQVGRSMFLTVLRFAVSAEGKA
jgi:hypothetical protein